MKSVSITGFVEFYKQFLTEMSEAKWPDGYKPSLDDCNKLFQFWYLDKRDHDFIEASEKNLKDEEDETEWWKQGDSE